MSDLLILEPVTLILESSTSSPLADESEDELPEAALGASLAVSATTSSAESSAWATTSPGLSAYKLDTNMKFAARNAEKNKFL